MASTTAAARILILVPLSHTYPTMAAACSGFGVFRRGGSEQLGPSTVVVRASRELLVSQLPPESLSRHRPCMMGLACFSTAAWAAGQRLALGARKLV